MRKKILFAFVAFILAAVPLFVACAPEPAPAPSPAPAPTPSPAPSPAPAPEVFKWKLQGFLPAGGPTATHSQVYFTDMVRKLSNGRLDIASHGVGEIVGFMEVGDAASKGVIEMACWSPMMEAGKHPAGAVLGGPAFMLSGLTDVVWFYEYGGKELCQEFWDLIGSNVKVLGPFDDPCGTPMWLTKKVDSLEDMKGLKVRATGTFAQILKQADLGVEIVMLPGGEIYTALETGVIDGAEFAAPADDFHFGFHEVCPYHLIPGWHEPVKPTFVLVNKDAWAELPDDLKFIVEVALDSMYVHFEHSVIYGSAVAYQEILKKSQPIRLTDAELAQLYEATQAYYDEVATYDEFAARVVQNLRDFEALMGPVNELWDYSFEH